MTEALQTSAGILKREQIKLFEEYRLGAGCSVRSDLMKAEILNIVVRAIVSGTVRLNLEEFDGEKWRVTDSTEALEGETVWHHQLQWPEFRFYADNPGPGEVELNVAVSVIKHHKA
ncbi:hypothetical protein ACP3TJ_06050 [Desulforudis sp. 1088]|uniref:hypothetical protein n=1 Tax=unclassified Candidatus Desulforudis TaxID=2635950 RepID=UPI003BEDD2F1